MENTETKSNKAPSHIAYLVKGTKDKSYYTRIGAAWAHKDRKGLSLKLESLPLNGKISLSSVSEE